TKRKLFEVLVMIPKGYAFSDIRSLNELKLMYPQQWRIMDEYLQLGWEQFRLLLEQGRKEGVLRPFDPYIFIDMYVGALNYYMDHRTAAERHGRPLAALLEETARILLQGVYTDQARCEGEPEGTTEGEER